MAFTNGSPYVAPTRSATSTFSTLPLSLAAPAKDGTSFVLNFSSRIVNNLKGNKCLDSPKICK